MFSADDLERAGRYLEPLNYHTKAGVQVTAYQARDPSDTSSSLCRVAYKTYTSPAMPAVITGPAVLFIHDAHQSGFLYDQAACALAEQGVFAAALSLGGHGIGHWCSLDAWPLEQMTIERYCCHVRLVVQAMPVGGSQLIVVGGGVLGGVLAQRYAGDHAVAGIGLLGGCLPHLAVVPWKADFPPRRWWQRRPTSPTTVVPPPDQTVLRRRWLGFADVTDGEVFEVWRYLGSESPQIGLAYQALAAGKPTPPPSLPALILAGQADAIISRTILEQTAKAYQTMPVVIPDAPHLLVRSPQRQVAFARLAAFCLETVRKPGVPGQVSPLSGQRTYPPGPVHAPVSTTETPLCG